MMQRRGSITTFAASLMLAGGVCMAQAEQPAVRDTLPQGQGAAADKAGASDRATGAAAADPAQPAAGQQPGAAAHGGMAMQGGKQVDQQVEQQLQKIMQSKEMAGDKLFVVHTAVGNQFEMAFAQLAQQKSQNPQVKQVAQTILQDHGQAGQQLQQVAQKLQIELPQGLPSMKQQELQIIGQMDPEMFDKKYIGMNDALHAKDVTEYRHVSQMAQSPDVKQFASQTLPKLQQHHAQIKQAAQQMGMGGGMEAQPAGGRIEGSTPRTGSDAGTSAPPRTGGNTDQPGLSDPQRSGSNPKIPGQGTTTPPPGGSSR